MNTGFKILIFIKWVGVLFWLAFMMREAMSGFKNADGKNLLFMLVVSAICVGLFYGSGLLHGEHTPIAVIGYWHCGVRHL